MAIMEIIQRWHPSNRLPTTTMEFIQRWRSSNRFLTFVICFVIFAEQWAHHAIAPVLPFSLHPRQQVPEDRTQFWISVLFGVIGATSFATSLPWGWLSDHCRSKRWLYLVGILLQLGGSLVIWFGSTIAVQIVGRMIQGFANTIGWTTGMAILFDAVGEARSGEYMGYVGVAVTFGSFLAPVLSGILFEKCGYDAVMGVIVAIIGFAIVLCLFLPARSFEPPIFTNEEPFKIDSRKDSGQADVAVQEVAPDEIIGEDTVPRRRSLGQKVLRSAILCLLRGIRFDVALWTCFVLATTFSGLNTVIPLHAEITFAWGSLGAGLIFLPMSIPGAIGPLTGRMTDRFGGRWFTCASLTGLFTSLLLLRLVNHDSINQKVLFCALLALVGLTSTVIECPTLAEITRGASRLEERSESGAINLRRPYSQAFALFNMAFAAGDSVGPFLAGLVADGSGWKTMSWALALLAGLTAVPVGLFYDGWLLKKRNL